MWYTQSTALSNGAMATSARSALMKVNPGRAQRRQVLLLAAAEVVAGKAVHRHYLVAVIE
jgi:hypothetical protein